MFRHRLNLLLVAAREPLANSSIVAPLARFSKGVYAGTLVRVETQAPLLILL